MLLYFKPVWVVLVVVVAAAAFRTFSMKFGATGDLVERANRVRIPVQGVRQIPANQPYP